MKLSIPTILWNTILLFKNTLLQWRVYLFYAVILMLVTGLTGQWKFSCETGDDYWWCYSFKSPYSLIASYIIFFVVSIFLYFSFCVDIYRSSFGDGKWNYNMLYKLDKERLKKIGILFGSVVLFITPILLAIKILVAKPNPDWRIEFFWFLLTFICCWMPFLFIRFSAAISFVLENPKLPPFRKIWQETSNKNFSIIFSYSFLFLCISFVQARVSFILTHLGHNYKSFILSLSEEFLNNILLLMYVSLFLMVTKSLQMIILSKNQSPSDKNSAMDSLKNDTTLPEAENDNSRVKKTAKKTKAVKSRKNKKEKK